MGAGMMSPLAIERRDSLKRAVEQTVTPILSESGASVGLCATFTSDDGSRTRENRLRHGSHERCLNSPRQNHLHDVQESALVPYPVGAGS